MIDKTPAHSKLGASSYYRWGKSLGGCPGSVRLCEGVESKSSVYAEEGTRAHELAAEILLLKTPSATCEDDAVLAYVEYVWERGRSASHTIFVEKKFDLSHYYPGCFGTADAIIYYPDTKKMVVIDFKYGAGVPVEVEENSQLMYYGLGAMHEINLPVVELELVIVQPRCEHPDGPIRSWKTTPMRVLDFVADLIDDAKATEDPNAPLNPGDHCRWCPAQHQCPAVREKALALAAQEFAPQFSYDPEKLSETLHNLPLMESWIKSVREFAYREAQHGRVPPGWKLVNKRATRKWKDEEKAKDALSFEFESVGPTTIYETKLKSPAQIEKMITKKEREILTALVVQESSGQTLVPDTDRRPSTAQSAKEVFDVIEG